jgi:hypothetical protein
MKVRLCCLNFLSVRVLILTYWVCSVFLLVARGDHVDEEKAMLSSSKQLLSSGVTRLDQIPEMEFDQANNSKSERSTARSQMDLTNESLFFRHLIALTRKRAANFTRDKKAWFCTTLLPSTIVLVGLLLTTFLPTSRNLQPITLDFKKLNPDVTAEPINPVSFNNPSNPYLCSPGLCSYSPQVTEVNETNEIYGFCGYTAKSLDANPNISNMCSNTVSNEIMQYLDSGATGIVKEAGDITNVSFFRH